jgi:RNA polymerase sigma factor (sigma-70 family)
MQGALSRRPLGPRYDAAPSRLADEQTEDELEETQEELALDEPEPEPEPDDAPDLSASAFLLRKVQQGDRNALNELCERYKPRVRRIIRVRLGSQLQRHLDAEDLLQEVFVIAIRKIPELELRGHSSILQWFSKVAINLIRNKLEYYSATKRDVEREVRLRQGSSSDAGGVHMAAPGHSPSQMALRKEFEELLDSYVKELEPPEYQEVILQRDYYGASWEEINVQLGRPSPEAVRELYRRAHLKLWERMRKHLERE